MSKDKWLEFLRGRIQGSDEVKSGQTLTLTDLARKQFGGFLEPIVRLIGRTGVSPNVVTLIGTVLNLGVAWILAQGHLRIGGLLVPLVSLFDAVDGTLARLTGKRSRFGAFLDSIMDRFSEAIVYLGLLFYYTRSGARQEILLIYATIVGSLMVSYARARAEGLGLDCKVGLLTRLERVIILTIALILNQMTIALWVLAILTNFTALQRMYHVWRATHGEDDDS
ncbi:MAG: CDP-alcohol phosphatidyltransferase family protein [Chloroflexi bacterium]|nr:CDP-alcohol phosphatidyltransferase family protein [Chloroflexota bacterium]